MAKPKTKSFATQVFELNLQIQRIEKDPPIDDQIVIVDEMNILLTQVHSQTEKEIGLARYAEVGDYDAYAYNLQR